MSDNPQDPARIESELEQTRARLGTHLDELTRRLSPGQLLDEGLGYVRDGDGADFVRNLREQVRDNPMPAVLTGIGIAWLAMSRDGRGPSARSSSRVVMPHGEATTGLHATGDDVAGRAHRAGAAVTRTANETDAAFRARVAEAQGKVMGLTRQAQESAESFSDRVREALDHARQSAASLRNSAREGMHKAGDMAASGRDTAAGVRDRAAQAGAYASDAGSRLAHAMTENPLLLSAMSMTAGALFGALLPQTEFEERQFGQAGERAAGAAEGDGPGYAGARGTRGAGRHGCRHAGRAGRRGPGLRQIRRRTATQGRWRPTGWAAERAALTGQGLRKNASAALRWPCLRPISASTRAISSRSSPM